MNQRKTLFNNNGRLIVGGMDCEDIVKEFHSPIYVFDQKHIEDVCKTFTDSLSEFYGDGMISYASKAFCCKEIYRIISKFNMGADVVSLGELFTAKSANFNFDNLILHGNNKSFEELEYAVKNNVKYVVIDSVSEVDLLNDICANNNVIQDVLIRVNPSVVAHTHEFIQTAKIDSKFGFSIDNGEALDFIQYVISKKNLNLVGLHCHIGSQIFEIQSFVLAVQKMTDFYKKCLEELKINFSVLDMGGGFGIYYSGDDPKLTLEDYKNYVKTISEQVISCVKEKGLQKPFLILEPGRAIVGESGITLYTVGSTKTIKDVKNYLSIDGGMFENPRFALYQAKYSVVAPTKLNEKCSVKYSIAGKCCESGDIIAEDVYLPQMKTGDILAVLSTGAYNYSMASNYNRNLVPPVIMVKDGSARVVVKGQTLEDIIKNDI